MPRSIAVQDGVKTRLAKRVKTLRHARDWSQEALAGAAGLHRNYIGHIERQEVAPGLANLAALARAFGMSLSDFLVGV